ncbi:uricase-like [Patiria miniata]|uniref:Uricase n=1 Tax=Patiria miniata TaxID=46514 RepID=A0A914AJH6_PATMI|nr:uricase-like [Patiria miniata]XP_038063712.1 uricase-like [Patiria miniata]
MPIQANGRELKNKMSTSPQVEFVSKGTYHGKHGVRVMQHRRQGGTHSIREITVKTLLGLNTRKEYVNSDNSDVIPTDSQKNTVYALAKAKGITTPEQFALDLCQHFMGKYNQVQWAEITVEDAPWRRIVDQSGKEHAHAFIQTQEAKRYCVVKQERKGLPIVWAGLSDMRILKTTQSGFAGYFQDEYTSLPETDDRIVCSNIESKWRYSNIVGVDFDKTWELCKVAILDEFAGPPDIGRFSASIQEILYQCTQRMMKKVAEVDQVELDMPNIHYVFADLKKIGMENTGEIIMPTSDPYGIIRVAVSRTHSTPNSL